MKKYFFIELILLLIGISTVLCKSLKCTKPQICVPLKHCSSVNKMLYEEKLDDNQINEMKNLQCGYRKGLVYVCCNSSLPTPEDCTKFKSSPIELEDRIFNGNDTKLGEYPWAVLISRKWRNNDGETGYSDECGGSLINDRYILTAAHCVKYLNIDFKERLMAIERAKLGEWDLASDPDEKDGKKVYVQEVEIEKIIPHKKFRVFKYYNDIALLRLKEKINYTDFMHPICLPNKRQKIPPNLTVIGWGYTEKSNGTFTDVLKYANVNYVTNEECVKQSKRKLKSTQLCAGSQGADSCGGDSGGSLFSRNHNAYGNYWNLVGIVSYGSSECGNKNIPGVYTDVSKYINWIEQTIVH